jgi:hypothetical protein
LGIENAGENAQSARPKDAGKSGRKVEQGHEQQIGEKEIGLSAQHRVGETLGLHHADARLDAVLSRIFGGDLDGNRIHIARDDAHLERPGRGNGEDAGAGTDIKHATGTPPFEQPIESDQAASCRRVMGGAEGKASGVNLKRETTCRHPAAVVSAMHEEMACAYRAAQAFGLCHPILVGKRLDQEPSKGPLC